jgi:hypothetical protein
MAHLVGGTAQDRAARVLARWRASYEAGGRDY